jgi:hypothetical protein
MIRFDAVGCHALLVFEGSALGEGCGEVVLSFLSAHPAGEVVTIKKNPRPK